MRSFTLLLLGTLLAVVAWAWFTVPAIPQSHTAWDWFLPPLGAAGLTLLFRLLANGIEHHPKLVNLPDRERLLALPAPRRRTVLRHAGRMLDYVALEMVGIFALVQVMLYMEGVGGPYYLVLALVLALSLGVSPVIVFLFVARMQDEIKRQWRELHAERGTEASHPR